MESVGFVIVIIGFCIGLLNWPICIRRIIKQQGPSGVPMVGMILMTLGILIMPGQPHLNYIWFTPIVDFSCLPLLVYGLVNKKYG